MTLHERRALAARFGFECGYCGTTEVETGASHTVDHFQPSSRGGPDDETNWVYACFACNGFKSDYWPQNHSEQSLLHPLHDATNIHWRETPTGELEPITPQGTFHIEKLHLNRP